MKKKEVDGEEILNKILGRKRRNLISRCARIFERFDPDQSCMDDLQDFPLSSFIYEIVQEDPVETFIAEKKEDKELCHEIFYRHHLVTQYASFAMGYVIGNMFDFPNPKIQKHVEAIRKVLKEENLLPYLPREKKAA